MMWDIFNCNSFLSLIAFVFLQILMNVWKCLTSVARALVRTPLGVPFANATKVMNGPRTSVLILTNVPVTHPCVKWEASVLILREVSNVFATHLDLDSGIKANRVSVSKFDFSVFVSTVWLKHIVRGFMNSRS